MRQTALVYILKAHLGKLKKCKGGKRDMSKKLRMKGSKYIDFRKPKDKQNTFHDTPRYERRLKPDATAKILQNNA